MWVMYQRADLPHFRNHTNNRLENYFGKFKKGVKPSSTVADCVEKLIKGARRSALQRTLDNRVGRAWNSNYDEEMNNVLRFTTHFVAGAVFPEYARALDQASVYTYDFSDGPDGQCVEVVSKTHTHQVDLTDWSCNCEFATSMRLPCRHAMAYRKKHGGAVIPLDRIDVRWQRATRALPILRRITVRHHAYIPSAEPPSSGCCEDATSARYGQAMRLLEPICSELAEVAEPALFKEYCDFLLEQWRVVRECAAPAIARLRSNHHGTSSPTHVEDALHGGARGEDAPVELSQANSLYSADVGSPPSVDTTAVTIGRPVDVEDALHGHDGARCEDAPVDLSQANSLYSADVGSLSMVDTTAVTIGQPVDLIIDTTTPNSGRNMDKPRPDMDWSDVDMEKDEEKGGGGSRVKSPTSDLVWPLFKEVVPLNFNKKAPKHGHPGVDEKKVATATKTGRIQYNESQSAAKVRGAQSLGDLLDNLNETQDGIHATLIALTCIPEKHSDHKNSKPKLESHAKPVLTTSDFFLLPKTLVSTCLKKLPPDTSPITVDTPTGFTPPPPPAKNTPVKVLRIAGVGLFSTEQIRLMHRVWTLRYACREGEKFCEWLEESRTAAMPLHEQEQLTDIIHQFKARYPFAKIPGVHDSYMVMVYRIMPASATNGWFCAGLIRAFGARMEAKYEFVRFAGVFEPDPRQKKSKSRQVVSGEALLHESVSRQLEEDGVRVVGAIVNHGNSHWTSLLIDGETKNVAMYDSFGATTRFERMAWDLAAKLGALYDVTAINSPRQVDGHSCGILSCYKFWQKADSTVPRSMEPHALPRRQFEFLHFVMTGKIVK